MPHGTDLRPEQEEGMGGRGACSEQHSVVCFNNLHLHWAYGMSYML